MNEILFFKLKNEHYLSNPLKEFIYFIRSKNIKGPFSFSLFHGEDTLHQDLTIAENFNLDSIKHNIEEKKDEYLFRFISKIENQFTYELVKKLPNLQITVGSLSKETQELVALVKTLLSRDEYIFLVDSINLKNNMYFNLAKKALHEEARKFGRNVIIATDSQEPWSLNQKLNQHDFHEDPYNFTLTKKSA